MKIHVMQHTALEGLGAIADWGAQHEIEFVIHRLDEEANIAVLNPAEMDAMIILGGPMSVNDDAPWLAAERILIRSLDKLDRPVLGICLGAQQIVRAFGASVYQNTAPEVGFWPVKELATGNELNAFHLHGEAMSTLPGSDLLYTSELTPNQGFIYHDNIVGLQFHWELTPDMIAAIVDEDLLVQASGDFVQPVDAIKAAPALDRAPLFAILDQLFG
ncbi:type 1 glutamine amidotransferase [Lacticaseibacillus saniviri]|uniref:GMP synthase glutamine amidotransferase subunit n=1 Tax=Lacticaseibacillus saniviri JCM 17471 = DSM 24301 TaxID=1293598 RepID=A0A0R2MTE9_9LACO|nr:type 1 glutamine amidotransferase [Lacticaseibacillus saniviri]KRO16911.1 GMP synthase glutamine amidotransferase subunit [Lacticaseibacillus saniviri JCM 17471 = DSM 24301]